MTIISRKDAKQQGLSYYFTGVPCKHDHISKRLTSSGICYSCSLIFKQTEKSKCAYKRYRQTHRDKVNHRAITYWHTTLGQQVKQLREDNPIEGYKHQRRWEKSNPGKKRAIDSKRRAALLQAIPVWYKSEQAQIVDMYKESSRLTKETGILYTVDHIIPLQNNIVCGLHCLSNLRIIPGNENFSKNNKLIEDLFY